MTARMRRVLIVSASLLLGLAPAYGCASSADPGEPLYPTSASPLPARPGAYVWTVGSPLLVLSSPNGGASWTTSHRAPSNRFAPISAVAFADSQHGWALQRQGSIFATTDGGTTWSTQGSRASWRLLDVACSDRLHAWVVGFDRRSGRGIILSTSDGGRSWSELRLGISQLERVAFSDTSHGWVIGMGDRFGFVLGTSDGGRHWNVQLRRRLGLMAVACSDARHCWVVGADSELTPMLVIATKDGGAHWSKQAPGSVRTWLRDVTFPDSRHGWAVGDGGVIIATSDGGQTWRRQASGTAYDLAAVSFSDASHGWAVKAPGSLLTTSDGGHRWTLVAPTAQHDVLTDVTTLAQ
jgi:photosystem II stability/assembly factor-like uncharacterized protein